MADPNALTQWLVDNGFLGVGINTFDTLYGIPGEEEEGVRIDLKQRRIDLRGGLRFAEHRLADPGVGAELSRKDRGDGRAIGCAQNTP